MRALKERQKLLRASSMRDGMTHHVPDVSHLATLSMPLRGEMIPDALRLTTIAVSRLATVSVPLRGEIYRTFKDALKNMPSSHTSLHFHLVFSTKERVPLMTKEWRERLHAYLGGIVKGLEGVPLAIGGIEDHVHLLVGLKSSHRLDYFLRDLKADSSEWVHREIGRRMFGWQKGYGAFTVSPSNIEGVKRYVLSQEKHHQRKTFQEEYIELLKASGIEYDERYVW